MCESCSARLSGGQNPDLWVTMELVEWMGHEQWALMLGATYPSYCGCGEGAWLGSDSECHICGEGLICSGMGTVTVEPGYLCEGCWHWLERIEVTLASQGYFAPADNAADVWQCHGVWERCPGGRFVPVPSLCMPDSFDTVSCHSIWSSKCQSLFCVAGGS